MEEDTKNKPLALVDRLLQRIIESVDANCSADAVDWSIALKNCQETLIAILRNK